MMPTLLACAMYLLSERQSCYSDYVYAKSDCSGSYADALYVYEDDPGNASLEYSACKTDAKAEYKACIAEITTLCNQE